MQSMTKDESKSKIFQTITPFLSRNSLCCLSKSVVVSTLVLYIFYMFLSSHPCCRSSEFFVNLRSSYKWENSSDFNTSKTSISHLVFGIAGSCNTWRHKKMYIEPWWRPNKTRGYVFFERYPHEYLPWPSTSPTFRVSENTFLNYESYNKHRMPHAIRMVRVILETFREEQNNVRWYVMADDDTLLFVDNLVDVLSSYDHTKYFYIGMNSECVTSNYDNSFGMAFGGAGYALSYPLAKAVAKNLHVCIKRYPTLFGSDHILQSCIADIGVSLTQQKGFHQIDLHWDISGLLSAHPQSPFLSLHHLDVVNPLFPNMERNASVKHLMKAANVDESRLLQQTICYDKQERNWTLAISWGYSAQIYENIFPPSFLQRPLETFSGWRKSHGPPYMFNTRWVVNNSCEAPHVFYFKSVEIVRGKHVATSYVRSSPRGLPACSTSGNHSADYISTIQVFSPLIKRENLAGSRRECCDIVQVGHENNVTTATIRACMEDEIVG